MKSMSIHHFILLAVIGLIFILIFLTLKASASSITVPDDYPTIQEAVNNAGDGDTILVKAGIYYENVGINSTTFVEEPASLTLQGEDQKTEIIGNSGTCITVNGAYDVTITGFKLRDGEEGIRSSYSSGGLIYKNTITHIEKAGIVLLSTKNLTIRACNISSGIYASTYWKEYPAIIEDSHIFQPGLSSPGSRWERAYIRIRNTTFNKNILWIYKNSEIIFKDSFFLDSDLWIDSTGGYYCDVRAVNTHFNSSFINVGDGGTLIVQNYLEVSSSNAIGISISGVDVKIEDNGNITYTTPYFGGTDPKTDSKGKTDRILITDRIYNSSHIPIENITTVEVYHPDIMFQDNPRDVDMKESHTEIFQSPNESPTARITSPMESQGFFEGDTIAFSGYATDPEEGALYGNSLVWESSLNGTIGVGTEFDLTNLSIGNHTITLMAVDGLGANATAVVNITIEALNEPPTAHITSPTEAQDFFEGDTIAFSGYATDPEEGALYGNSLVWESSLDGIIGFGTKFNFTNLSIGNHTITLLAVDDLGANATAFVNITIEVYSPPTDDNGGYIDNDGLSNVGSINTVFLILIAILITAVIILLIRNRRKGTKAQSQIIEVSPALQSQLIRCPSCNHGFEVADRPRPLMVRCPNCGTEGMLNE